MKQKLNILLVLMLFCVSDRIYGAKKHEDARSTNYVEVIDLDFPRYTRIISYDRETSVRDFKKTIGFYFGIPEKDFELFFSEKNISKEKSKLGKFLDGIASPRLKIRRKLHVDAVPTEKELAFSTESAAAKDCSTLRDEEESSRPLAAGVATSHLDGGKRRSDISVATEKRLCSIEDLAEQIENIQNEVNVLRDEVDILLSSPSGSDLDRDVPVDVYH